MEIPAGLIGDIIFKNVNIIKYNIDNILNEMKSKKIIISNIMFTGGFSKNKIFEKEIERYLNNIPINYLTSFENTISKGAVIYGINPNKIKSRICKQTIGIRNKKSNKDSIQILVKKGQEIDNLSITKYLKISSNSQEKIQLNIYCSENEKLNENEFFGRLLIDIDPKNKNHIIQPNINYDTVLSFYAINYGNKKEIKTKFEFFK